MKTITLDLFTGEVFGVYGWGLYTGHKLPRYVKLYIPEHNPRVWVQKFNPNQQYWEVYSVKETALALIPPTIQQVKIPAELWEDVITFQVHKALTK